MGFYEDRIFPPLLDVATRPFRRDRQALIARASGRVLEIGMGTGANLPYYTGLATEVVGLEPSKAMLAEAEKTAARLSGQTRYRFVVGSAEAMPFPDQSFDTVVACLVFCTIPDARGAAREALRVLRPGGDLLFFEHVAHPRPSVHRWQQRVNPLWRRLACGCELTRDTQSVFADAGFLFTELETLEHPKALAIANAMLRGRATRN